MLLLADCRQQLHQPVQPDSQAVQAKLTAAAVFSEPKCKIILAQVITCGESGMTWLGADSGGVSDVPFRGPHHGQVR